MHLFELLKSRLDVKEINKFTYAVFKSYGLTSYSIVDLFKQAFKRPVGHGGTLDPMAVGELIVGVYPATKKLSDYLLTSKYYEVDILWGCTSPSFDLETPLDIKAGVREEDLSQRTLEQALQLLKAKKQILIGPYSALKSAGKPFYKGKQDAKPLARYKENTIYSFKVIRHTSVDRRKLVHYLQRLLGDLLVNKKSYLELGKHFKLRRAQVELFDKFEEVLTEHIDRIKTSEVADSFYISRVQFDVGRGTYIRYLVGELGSILSIPTTALYIRRWYNTP